MSTELAAYFDDSGHPDDQDVVLVAGWVGNVEQRVVWEQGWKQVLRDFKIRSGFFHMTDFEAAPKCNDPTTNMHTSALRKFITSCESPCRLLAFRSSAGSIFVRILFYSPSYAWSPPGLEKGSDIHESACSVLLGSRDGKRHTGRLHAISASSYEGPHIRLRYPVPDHVACIEVSTFTHRLAGRIVVQEFNRRIRDGGWVLEGNQQLRAHRPAVRWRASTESR